MFDVRVRRGLWVVVGVAFVALLGLSLARYLTVHQRTFDLALYARISWGFAHGDLWSPVLNTHALGAHVAPVLVPLGLLGRVFGTVPVLLVAQAACIALTVIPMARIGARRLGTRGIWLAAAAFLLYPNLFHVGTYEFHPGTLAVLPMTWAFDALDRANLKQLALSCVLVLCCREDLGVFCLLITLVYYAEQRDRRALFACAGYTLYMAGAIALTLAHAPENASLTQHFGPWGGSPFGIVRVALEDPERVLAHFQARERLHYLPRILAPLSFFSLRAPKLLLPALPYLLLNLISVFPTSQQQYSHYLTPALPALIVAGVVGVTEVRKKTLQRLWYVTLAIGHVALGGSPLSIDFDRAAFRSDEQTTSARKVLAAIPEGASVQAPDALLPHLAERHDVRRAPPPEAGSDFVVLDVSHRQRYARQEVLLRTSEEPFVRSFAARADQALLVYAPPYALFARGRADQAPTCLRRDVAAVREGVPVTACLTVEQASLVGERLTLLFRARATCAADLALRLGPDPMPAHVALLCEGALSPARVQPGDLIESVHPLTPREASEVRARGLWVGALRASGAPPEPGDPAAVSIALEGAASVMQPRN